VFVLGADKAREFFGVLAHASMLPLGQHWPGLQRWVVLGVMCFMMVMLMIVVTFCRELQILRRRGQPDVGSPQVRDVPV